MLLHAQFAVLLSAVFEHGAILSRNEAWVRKRLGYNKPI
jgi:hypothetical protein